MFPAGRSRTALVDVFAFEVRRRDLPERAVALAPFAEGHARVLAALVAVMNDAIRLLCCSAMVSAVSTSSAVICSPMAQLTMRRLHTSRTTAKKMKPAQVGT